MENSIISGWTVEIGDGLYHFDHILKERAEALTSKNDELWVVETINWTEATGNDEMVHHNQYFAWGIRTAATLAAKLASYVDIPEDLIGMRPASDAEAVAYSLAWNHFHELMPQAVSDNDWSQLARPK